MERVAIRVLIAITLFLSVSASVTVAQQQEPQDPRPAAATQKFTARDSLEPGNEPSADARACLEGLTWKPGIFSVHLEPTNKADMLVRFPSPQPRGDATNDMVAVEWHQARDLKGNKKKQKAFPVVIVHELGRNMAAGRAMAVGLSRAGFHAFMVQLPTYGKRRGQRRYGLAQMLEPMQQAIADVRRARDAISVLPAIDMSHVALQGTSLGGIIAASSGSLDKKFDSVHLLLAGGDLRDMLKNGKRDTAAVRNALERAGVTERQLRQMTSAIEPTRIAHRLRPDRTWLYSGKSDTVVPMRNAVALARSAKLSVDHHVKVNANHYTAMVYLPWVVTEIKKNIKNVSTANPSQPDARQETP